jgi:hypothetical protein
LEPKEAIAYYRVYSGVIYSVSRYYIYLGIFLSKAVLSVLLYNYLKYIVKTIVAAYRIVMIPLKDLLL